MTWPYGDVNGFFLRFPKTQVSSVEVSSFFLFDASIWVDERLSKAFTVPFSSNNLTAQRLTYMKCLHLVRLRTIAPDDAKELGDEVEHAVTALLCGSASMIQLDPASGSVPLWGTVNPQPGQVEHVVADGFGPTFGLGSPLTQYPDANRVESEVLGRPTNRPAWEDEL